jgi:chromosome segregation protein
VHLRAVVLKGFKSFPDRTRLEFAPGVSVIVGPNGSGKSNVTDAVLWALGEQSPGAVRGQSMQDVIFAGAHGVQARAEAEVEVVLDNADGAIDLPAAEISILRRLNRAGEGEYRVNGARCRLGDVLELLSDTGLGREMHSIVSQGRVAEIVTSRPRERRLLIEEAAGLGKHRRRRRRAQLKLDRTQDNLDRALDVEREARTRLKPLKRQAEAAELHARLERQCDEARWTLAREAARAAGSRLDAAETAAAAARGAAAAIEAELAAVAARREAAEQALAARGDQRERLSGGFHAARSAHERVGLRLESARAAVVRLGERAERRRALLAALAAEAAADTGDDGAAERVAGLEAELGKLAEDRAARLERELVELERRRSAAAVEVARLEREAERAATARGAAEEAAEGARTALRAAERTAEAARREAARLGAELAKVNQFLRAQAGAPGGAPALADALGAEPGYELALAAALGTRLRAAVAEDVGAAARLLDRAGSDGGAALVAPATPAEEPAAGAEPAAAPTPDALPLADHVTIAGDGPAARLAQALLRDVWVVEDAAQVDPAFSGVAVTRAGRLWAPAAHELRQLSAGGEDRVLAERNRRAALVAEVDAAARAEHVALVAVQRATHEADVADAARDDADHAARGAARERADAGEAERHARHLIEQRRAAPDDGPAGARRAQLESALAAERRLGEQAERARAAREERIARERAALAADAELAPQAERLAAALAGALDAVGARTEALAAELAADRDAGERLALELRSCAQEEAAVHARLREHGEEVTRQEVAAQRARDAHADARAECARIAERLGLDSEPAPAPLEPAEHAALAARVERLLRRREQLGPVNPLAQEEYAEALAHVEELEARREDLEVALRELQTLIRDTDKRIREAFDETFTAAAANFEEVVGRLFPGGRGRLRLVREDAGPRPVLGGGDAPEEDEAEPTAGAAAEAGEAAGPGPDAPGVEIELTPAGKATKRLSLLSGGEKSLTALAFLFAVFLARPCPFYVLDEVEAALDDLNIDRVLALLRGFADRAQFIVVTHQKRTMEAADCLYGVSMAADGVSRVVSRRLPPRAIAAA